LSAGPCTAPGRDAERALAGHFLASRLALRRRGGALFLFVSAGLLALLTLALGAAVLGLALAVFAVTHRSSPAPAQCRGGAILRRAMSRRRASASRRIQDAEARAGWRAVSRRALPATAGSGRAWTGNARPRAGGRAAIAAGPKPPRHAVGAAAAGLRRPRPGPTRLRAC